MPFSFSDGASLEVDQVSTLEMLSYVNMEPNLVTSPSPVEILISPSSELFLPEDHPTTLLHLINKPLHTTPRKSLYYKRVSFQVWTRNAPSPLYDFFRGKIMNHSLTVKVSVKFGKFFLLRENLICQVNQGMFVAPGDLLYLVNTTTLQHYR